ncbi:hypothetical protein E0H35_23755 [Rhizobium leguminosarum bv. viciae]|nr:hypothetical protein [Rhizobium leguminosarum bv. viciae]NKK48260.1 hypothetical protein [Rhizobium leguminosarum bv. viciae]TBY95613.1 hypothetical protein E0H35_23755 [Rhizobium leguminosarum bv. viciae]
MCRGRAAPAADARDKPEHDEREVGRLCQQSVPWLTVLGDILIYSYCCAAFLYNRIRLFTK